MEDKKLYDAGDDASISKKKTKAQLQKELEDAQLKAVLETKEGRAILWRLLVFCKLWDSSFVPASTEFTAFKEGARNVGLKILKDVQSVDKSLYFKMQDENYLGEKNV